MKFLVKYRGWIILLGLVAALVVLYFYLNKEENGTVTDETEELAAGERRFIPMR